MNHEETKLNDTNIGLLNLSEDNANGIYKMKLQVGELKSFSFFDGEVVVAEGFNDSSNGKFNVVNIHKLQAMKAGPALSFEEAKRIAVEDYRDRSLQLMIACGPYTLKNSLSYQGLLDFLQIVRKEQP